MKIRSRTVPTFAIRIGIVFMIPEKKFATRLIIELAPLKVFKHEGFKKKRVKRKGKN